MPDQWKVLHRRELAGATSEGERDSFKPWNGPVQWLRWKIWPWWDRSRRVDGIFVSAENVTARIETERSLSESEDRLRSIVGMATDAIIVIDEKGLVESINPAGEQMFGYAADEVIGRNVSMLMPEPVRSGHQTYIDVYCRTGVAKIIGTSRDVEHERKDGSLFTSNLTVSECRVGGRRCFAAIVRDFSKRKLQEDKIKLLIRELNHRSKNMLALVQAVARQTFATKPNEFIARFEERIEALTASQDLLAKNEWRNVPLDALVRSQLAHFTDLIPARIEIKGLPLALSTSSAQTIGMALHELATNASKYGALSSQEGGVKIAWQLKGGAGGEERFELVWAERGGPEVFPPERPGFGTALMEEIPRLALDARITLDYAKQGFRWRLDCPAKTVLDNYGAGITSLSDDRLGS